MAGARHDGPAALGAALGQAFGGLHGLGRDIGLAPDQQHGPVVVLQHGGQPAAARDGLAAKARGLAGQGMHAQGQRIHRGVTGQHEGREVLAQRRRARHGVPHAPVQQRGGLAAPAAMARRAQQHQPVDPLHARGQQGCDGTTEGKPAR